MNNSIRLHYCIPPDYQFMIVEIYIDGDHFGEINTENGEATLKIFNSPKSQYRLADPGKLTNAIEEAQSELRKRSLLFANDR